MLGMFTWNNEDLFLSNTLFEVAVDQSRFVDIGVYF
jgi:hypothetical protein